MREIDQDRAKFLRAVVKAPGRLYGKAAEVHRRPIMICAITARTPLINGAQRTRIKLTDIAVSRLRIDMPPRMASMNKLMVLPRRDAAMVACNRGFAEVLLIKKINSLLGRRL